jgi:membrane-anchored mycosin MYCP
VLARTRRRLVALLAALCVAAFVADVASAAGSPPSTTATTATTATAYAKYYVVTSSYQGKPETLFEIASRFLRNSDRWEDVFTLNAGVVQRDGGELSDPTVLHQGWALVLPWDALGDGVQYGLPPLGTVLSAGAQPPATAPAPPAGTSSTACAGTPATSDQTQQAQWAMLRLAPNRAWPYSRGQGVSVAVVDSGVDASVPQLAGRVAQGSDIVGGTGRGNIDCLGSGTAMASLIVGQAGSGFTGGVAPDATVLPVRIAVTDTAVSATDQASAIQVAVDGGAKVIVLGALVDPTQAQVAAAIARAVTANVVVVTGTLAAADVQPAGVLRVGAIGIDGRAYGGYPAGAADVVAPGVDVASLGISGTGQVLSTGDQYAVALAAGEAALVRSKYGDLTAAQVVRRIEASADRVGATAPDPTYGYGLIDPYAAVTMVIPDEASTPAPVPVTAAAQGWSGRRIAALAAAIVIALLLLLLLTLRIRSMVRADGAVAAAEAEPAAASGTEALTERLPAQRAGPASPAAARGRERATSAGEASDAAPVAASAKRAAATDGQGAGRLPASVPAPGRAGGDRPAPGREPIRALPPQDGAPRAPRGEAPWAPPRDETPRPPRPGTPPQAPLRDVPPRTPRDAAPQAPRRDAPTGEQRRVETPRAPWDEAPRAPRAEGPGAPRRIETVRAPWDEATGGSRRDDAPRAPRRDEAARLPRRDETPRAPRRDEEE